MLSCFDSRTASIEQTKRINEKSKSDDQEPDDGTDIEVDVDMYIVDNQGFAEMTEDRMNEALTRTCHVNGARISRG